MVSHVRSAPQSQEPAHAHISASRRIALAAYVYVCKTAHISNSPGWAGAESGWWYAMCVGCSLACGVGGGVKPF